MGPGGPGSPRGPGIALQGPTKIIIHTVFRATLWLYEKVYIEITILVQVIVARPSVDCLPKHDFNITLADNSLYNISNCNQLKNHYAHKSNNPEAKHKRIVIKGAIRWKRHHISYLLHPPVLHLLLDYSHLAVVIEKKMKERGIRNESYSKAQVLSQTSFASAGLRWEQATKEKCITPVMLFFLSCFKSQAIKCSFQLHFSILN